MTNVLQKNELNKGANTFCKFIKNNIKAFMQIVKVKVFTLILLNESLWLIFFIKGLQRAHEAEVYSLYGQQTKLGEFGSRHLTRSSQRARHHRNSHGLGPVMPNSTRYFCLAKGNGDSAPRAPAANEQRVGDLKG